MNKKADTENKIKNMRIAGGIISDFFDEVSSMIKPGVTTKEIDSFAHKFIVERGAKPSFLHYSGFPASICTSVDDVIVHGIPKNIQLKSGQVLGIDVGACYNGYHVDAARTYLVGNVAPDVQKLVEVTRECFFEAIKGLKNGSRVGDIGSRVQRHAEKFGYGVVRELVGHGVGNQLHEQPNIPNYGIEGLGPKLVTGQTIAIEPMINLGTPEVVFRGMWDCRTADGKPSSHYENTVVILDDGVEILTEKMEGIDVER